MHCGETDEYPYTGRCVGCGPGITAERGLGPGLGRGSSLRSASMDGGQDRRPTVYMHIGPPKTGTTYIQSTLRAWHKDLKLAGFLFPGIPMFNHFTAALDARGNLGYGIHVGEETERTKAVGAWDRLLKKARSFDGTVIISHEVFASCDDEHARAAIRDLSGTELHLVVTARDPARQIVSSWQQRVRQGSKTPLDTVAENVQKRRALSSGQDISALTERWAHDLDPDHVHIVTVPPSGSDPTLLWRRFAEVVGIDAQRFDSSRTQRSNEGRGWIEIELLRRLNVALDDRMPHVQFHRMVPRYYAGKILAGLPSSRKVMMPESLRPVADDIADRWIETIKQRGYDLAGDLEDLRPVSDETAAVEPSEAEIAGLAVAATAEMLLDDSGHDRGRPQRRQQARAAKQGVSGLVRRGRRRLSRARKSV
jgi:hypothetical protein